MTPSPALGGPPCPGLPVLIYAAKSTEDVRGSIPTQIADCRAAIEREGGRVLAAEPFADEAKSAYKGNRGDGLAAAKDAALELAAGWRRGDVPAVELWVQHSDRIARGDGVTADHLGEVWFAMRRQGVRLRSVQDDHNLEDALRAVLIGERNTEDSTRKAEAVRGGLRRTFDRGERLGGPVPDGYRLVKDFGERGEVLRSYSLDPDRAPVIRLAFELNEAGMGDPSIARELNRRGHRTRGGIAWTRRRVQDTLTNPFYAGRVVIHRGKPTQDVREGTHPALVDGATFDRLLAMRATRDRAKGSTRSPKGRPTTKYALARLARCGGCGEVMRPVTSPYRRKDGTQRRTYICAQAKDATGLCDAPAIDAEAVDAAVVARLTDYLGDFDAWRAQIEAGHETERERIVREVERARDAQTRAVRDADRVEARWRQYVAEGRDDDADLVLPIVRSARVDVDRAGLRLEAAERALQDVPTDAPADAMLDFYAALGEAVRGRLGGARELAQVNLALRDLFDRFVLTTVPDGVELLPVLDAGTAQRILGDVAAWPHGASLHVGGREVPLVGHVDAIGDGFAGLLERDPAGAAELLERLRELDPADARRAAGETLLVARLTASEAEGLAEASDVTVDVHGPPAAIVPPLRAFATGPAGPLPEVTNAQA